MIKIRVVFFMKTQHRSKRFDDGGYFGHYLTSLNAYHIFIVNLQFLNWLLLFHSFV